MKNLIIILALLALWPGYVHAQINQDTVNSDVPGGGGSGGGGLTESDINTPAKLNAFVTPDLADISGAQTFTNKTIDAAGNTIKILKGTDCTTFNAAVDGQYCWDTDDDLLYVCETADVCDTAGEWDAIGTVAHALTADSAADADDVTCTGCVADAELASTFLKSADLDTLSELATLSNFTISGNTTVLGTTSGTLTSGDCVEFDASGNLVAAGAACGAGGSGDIEAVGFCTSGSCAIEGGSDIFPFIYEGTADDFETTFAVTDPTTPDKTITFPDLTGTVALSANNLSFFASTTSAELKGVISDETGSGGALVFATSPTLTTPTLGVASATSINKVAITAPATGSTLTIADGKTLTVSNTMSFASAGDSGVLTVPNATATLVGRDTTDTLTNKTLTAADNVIGADTAESLAATPDPCDTASKKMTGIQADGTAICDQIDADEVVFDNTSTNFTSSEVDSAIKEFGTVDATGPNGDDWLVDYSRLNNVPAFNVPSGTNPTVSGAGDFAIDTTDQQLVYYGGSSAVVLTGQQSKCIVVEQIKAADDNMMIASWPDPVTINSVWCQYNGSAPSTAATFTLEDGGGNAMTITGTNPTCTAPGTPPTPAAVTANNTLAAYELLRFDTTNTPDPATDTYLICVGLVYDRQ